MLKTRAISSQTVETLAKAEMLALVNRDLQVEIVTKETYYAYQVFERVRQC